MASIRFLFGQGWKRGGRRERDREEEGEEEDECDEEEAGKRDLDGVGESEGGIRVRRS